MYCPNCGKKIPDEAVFCPECGARIEQAPKLSKQSDRRTSARQNRSSGGGFLPKLLIALIAVAGLFVLRGTLRDLFFEKESPPATMPPVVSNSQNSSGTSSGSTSYNQWLLGEKDTPDEDTSGQTQNSSSQGQSSSGQSQNSSDQPQSSSGQTQSSSGSSQKPSVPSGTGSSSSSGHPFQQNPAGSSSQSSSDTGAGTYQEDLMPQSMDYLTAVIFDDFIFPERMLSQGLPDNYEDLSLYEAKGAWKYELLFEESGYKEIGKCMIDFGQYAVLFDLYPEYSVYGNDMYPVTREEIGYQTYSGEMSDDAFILQVPDKSSTAVLGPFIRIEGTEFSFGSIVAGETGNIMTLLLTRP